MLLDEASAETEQSRKARSWPALLVDRRRPAPIPTAATRDDGGDAGQPGLDELIQAALLGCDVSAIEEVSEDVLRVFFATAAAREQGAAALTRECPALTFESLDVPDDDWVARSQAGLTHVRVGRIIVAPPWDRPITAQHSIDRQGSVPLDPSSPSLESCALTVVIEPSMGFGTGHHATTRLCLTALQQLDLRERAVIDVGTGSGVLAIGASLMGANPVIAIDNDADAIMAARGNLELNPGARVTFDKTDVRASCERVADIVIANLTGGLLVNAARVLRALVAPGGLLVLSGLMDHEASDVLAAFAGCHLCRRDQEEEWLCLTLRRSAP